jgi:hypothetical protein
MRVSRGVKPQAKLWACLYTALLLLLTGCQANASQGSNTPLVQSPANSGSGGVQITPHNGQSATPATGTFNSGASPGPVPAGNGPIPAAFPRYFSFGVMSPPASVSALDDMRSRNGAAFTFRYQYLTGGANTGRGWETWQKPAGQFATYYMQESDQHGYMPTFVFYEICLTNGPHPSDYCGAHNVEQDTANIDSASAMKAYFSNWVLMLQKIRAFGKPVLVIVEPDLWGFLQQAAHGSDTAASVPASVASSGFPDAAGFPNNAQGFAWALLHMRDTYAPNAILTLHASTWAAGNDIATSSDPGLDVAGMARHEAAFLDSAGLVGNPSGVSTWDLVSSDVADFDSAQPGGRSWWDRYNRTFPNFARYLTFIGDISQQTHRRVVMWQVPMGNQYFDTMNDTQGHYQDNRAEYILGHVSSFATAGIIAVLFGPGNGGTMNIDAMHDGVTNPAPINSYECNFCNNHVSSYSDDDGGFLRIFVGLYLKHPVAIS